MQITVQKSPVKGARDVIAIGDLPELANLADSVPVHYEERNGSHWRGGKEYNLSVSQIRSGDMDGVAASDKLVTALDGILPMTHAWKNIPDVVGGVPNVPAYLAGQPLNMRRRARIQAEQAPLCIFTSLELSGGIDIETMRKRGATILAFVRLLANTRPVELWACCSVGGSGYGSHVLTRIDTAPLDLARAAHVLTCPSVTRGVGYGVCNYLGQSKLNKVWSGQWAYASDSLYRQNALAIFKAAVSPSSEAMLISAAHSNDAMVNKPVDWLKAKLKEYGGVDIEI